MKLGEQRVNVQEVSSTMAEGGDDKRRIFWDFVTPGVQGITSSLTRPNVEAHNFKLKPALIFMVKQSQFGGTPLEDPSLHLSVFVEVCNTLKLNGVTIDVIQLWLFPFSLKDKARA